MKDSIRCLAAAAFAALALTACGGDEPTTMPASSSAGQVGERRFSFQAPDGRGSAVVTLRSEDAAVLAALRPEDVQLHPLATAQELRESQQALVSGNTIDAPEAATLAALQAAAGWEAAPSSSGQEAAPAAAEGPAIESQVEATGSWQGAAFAVQIANPNTRPPELTAADDRARALVAVTPPAGWAYQFNYTGFEYGVHIWSIPGNYVYMKASKGLSGFGCASGPFTKGWSWPASAPLCGNHSWNVVFDWRAVPVSTTSVVVNGKTYTSTSGEAWVVNGALKINFDLRVRVKVGQTARRNSFQYGFYANCGGGRTAPILRYYNGALMYNGCTRTMGTQAPPP